MTTTKSLRRVIATSLLILACSGLSAAAATFTVTSTADSGPGSLRQVVFDASAAPSADTIVFDASFNQPSTITLLTMIDLNLTTSVDNLTITGPGATLLTITTSANIPLFRNGDPDNAGDTVSISGLTLTRARQGAINNRGNLTVANVVFHSNTDDGAIVNTSPGTANVTGSLFNANVAGGITNEGTLTVLDSTFTANINIYGGAIYNNRTMSVFGCTFTDNRGTSSSATGQGGGAIHSNSGANATIVADSSFTGNAEAGGSGGGGAISNRSGPMTITNSTFTLNTAVAGGGAVSNRGSLSVTRSIFTQNSATGPNAAVTGQGSGGAIISSGGGDLTITDSIFSGNSAANHGGGIYFVPNASAGPPMVITNTTISGNTANSDQSGAGYGGGVSSDGTGPATITRSTISGNTSFSSGGSSGRGGGIYSRKKLTIDNCTVSGNSAGFEGGGIFDDYSGGGNSEVVITNSTIVFNQATTNGGGVRSSNSVGDTPASLGNTIVAHNTAMFGPDVFNPFGSQGFNLISVDPLLAALADNGGPTKTHALLAGSPAIDQGGTVSAATTDQRGLSRPFDDPNIANASGGDGSDIGTFEDQPPNTQPGSNVIARSPASDASVTFPSVSQGGFTTFIPIAPPSTAGQAPQGYTILDDAPAYDITTTATFTPPLIVGFVVDSITTPAEFARVRILHGENGQLVDRTILAPDSPPPDFANRTVYARVDSLSPFVIALAPVSRLVNISTRLAVQTGDNALIGGFIITGTQPKSVIIRAMGPSLPLSGVLADPILEFHGSDGTTITNDNWRTTQEAEILATGIEPLNDLESAIVATLPPGAHTAIVRGTNNTTGVGLVEVYDLDATADSRMGNVSTRGFVETGNNVLIGGTIITGSVSANVLVRAIGPSLTSFGVPNALGDPTLELRDGDGVLVASNDHWQDTQQTEIQATGLAPTNTLESAILQSLTPGGYTAIVRGKADTTGVALVEVYSLQ